MDHAKIMDKLASITGGLSSGDEGNVQFSKPKISLRREPNSVAQSMKGRLNLKPDDLGQPSEPPQTSKGGSKSALNKPESLIKQRRRVASQGMRTEKKVITVDGENAGRIRHNPLVPNIKMNTHKSRQNLQKTTEDEVKSPIAAKNVSPSKVSKTR